MKLVVILFFMLNASIFASSNQELIECIGGRASEEVITLCKDVVASSSIPNETTVACGKLVRLQRGILCLESLLIEPGIKPCQINYCDKHAIGDREFEDCMEMATLGPATCQL